MHYFFALLGIVIIGVIIYDAMLKYWSILLLLVAIAIFVYFLYKREMNKEQARIKMEKNKKQLEEEHFRAEAVRRRQLNEYNSTQKNIKKHLRELENKSIEVRNELYKELALAEESLNIAELEFNDKAFTPFWDAVEQTVTHLARFENDIKRIIEYSYMHDKERAKLDNASQPFKLNVKKFPNPMLAADRLRNVVRQAGKDYQFASIYEQRKTNQLLVKGFSNLGQALNQINSRIESSMAEISNSLREAVVDITESNHESTNHLIECNSDDLQLLITNNKNNHNELANVNRDMAKKVATMNDRQQSDTKARRDHEQKMEKFIEMVSKEQFDKELDT